jgi:MFS family permease
MFKKIINRFARPRHYWRDLGFDELSELYTSMMFRSLAMSLVGIFIPFYLYQLDYEIWQIFSFYAITFSAWAISAYPVGHLVAKVGPKHTILASYAIQVMWLLMLVTLENQHWPLLAIATLYGLSNCLFFIAFHVDFSKIKHTEHGGKEVGWMYSMERAGAVLGPLIGGLVAYFIGGEYIFMVAVSLLFVGLVPLFITREPTTTNQILKFDSLQVSQVKRDLISYGFLSLEHTTSVIMWPMFISIYVFTDNAYLQLGSIISFSVFISFFVARAIGKIIDRKKGRSLLRSGAILNAALHLWRPFVGTFPAALTTTLANEVVTPFYRMPYTKGMYDAADDLPGRRIVYITAMEACGASARAAPFPFLAILAFFIVDTRQIFTGIFILGAFASLGIMLERFRALKEKPV